MEPKVLRLKYSLKIIGQIIGGYGYMAEQAIEHYFLDGYAIGVTLETEEELKDRMITRIYDPSSPITPSHRLYPKFFLCISDERFVPYSDTLRLVICQT